MSIPEDGEVSPRNELFSLVVGYSTGIQVWTVSEHGDATETLSLRCGTSSIFREIPHPERVKEDGFASKRPLAAYTASQNGSVELRLARMESFYDHVMILMILASSNRSKPLSTYL